MKFISRGAVFVDFLILAITVMFALSFQEFVIWTVLVTMCQLPLILFYFHLVRPFARRVRGAIQIYLIIVSLTVTCLAIRLLVALVH